MLITIEDVRAYGNQVADDESALVGRLIRSASSAITDAAGCPILEGESTVTVLGTADRTLDLPGVPIRQVHEVTINGEAQHPDTYMPTPTGIYRPYPWALNRDLPKVTVRYTHGLPELPEDITALAVALVMAGLHAVREGTWEADNGRISSADIDDYREAYATTGESTEMVHPMMLPKRTREWLRTRFGGGARVVGTV